jgi:hypothetical protein
MSALHEITSDMKGLMKLVENGELSQDDITDTMEAIESTFEDKALSLIYVHDNINADVVAIDNEIERLQARKKVMTNHQQTMKEYLRTNMEASNISKIECPLFTITLKKGRDIVEILDSDKIPTDYLNIKTSVTPMKREILADLNEGKEIEGTRLTKSKTSLLIK